MTTMLTPPPVPPLPPDRRARLRHEVLRRAGGVQTTRRWVPALAAVATVATVAAVAVVPRLGGPNTAGPTDPVVASSSAATMPAAVTVDRGPATRAQVQAALRKCGGGQIEAVWSRRVVTYSSIRPQVITALITKTTPGQPGGYGLGLSACFEGFGASILDTDWRVPVNAEHPVHGLAGLGSGGSITREFSMVYRVDQRVARVESRYVWRGGAGAWYRGAIADGFAYCATYAKLPAGVRGVDRQVRAFDADGHEVPVS